MPSAFEPTGSALILLGLMVNAGLLTRWIRRPAAA